MQIIKVDPVSGALKFTFAYGRDMFPTEVGILETPRIARQQLEAMHSRLLICRCAGPGHGLLEA